MINKDTKNNSWSAETPNDPIKICIATTPEEKREIYHFRYKIYVEEMSRHLDEVDYDNKLLYDEQDEWALLLYAKVGSELIATKRINIGTISDFPQKIIELLSLETFQGYSSVNDDNKFAFITKVMVTPAHRSSPVLYLLMVKCYEICCHNHVQFIFGISNFHLIPLYEQMGCRRYYKNFFYPGHGLAVPIVLLTDDIQHFRKVRSPIFRIARRRRSLNMKTIEWFNAVFSNQASIINSQLITEDELWNLLCKRLNGLPTESMAVLQDLSEPEAKKFLHSCGIFVQCDPDDMLTFQGDISYTYSILLSGRLKSLTFQRPLKEYLTPGQHFGANGLTEHNKHTEEIAATSSAEILALSGIAFQKFCRSHPDIAHKIVRNTTREARKKPGTR
ncbi:Crp/Fnr family transcriptional regulator [Sporomusa aerivorans]|uniref:Crp/Fnr family transcriptional regulator n=1 Tax=Sporomusa aerivorans TaxID=204936 RepID=UPI00352A71DB